MATTHRSSEKRTDTDHPQERRARELLTQGRPLFLGVDGEGAAHYWDSYEWAVAVIEADGDAEKHSLPRTRTLAEWCEFVRDRRGWESEPNVGGSLVSDLVKGYDR
ncbi:hypothetical protein [Haloarcula argentinensis]|uniref:Uncharacterized protein n=1 Tax=Haloarcula argentinensis TaxID=43776 RepID=A0A847UPD4_HALAR|nr:hypothetical protein [Haloarcula argentinensis]NLV14377.1 hypothetical protein [Haloarcula argentinensis]